MDNTVCGTGGLHPIWTFINESVHKSIFKSFGCFQPKFMLLTVHTRVRFVLGDIASIRRILPGLMERRGMLSIRGIGTRESRIMPGASRTAWK